MFPIVRTFMDSETHALNESDDIGEALNRFIDAGVTGAPVVDDQGRVVGMLSEYECLRLLTHGVGESEMPTGHVADFMVREFPLVKPDMDVYYVAGLFLADPPTRRFPVVEGYRLVGVITRKDILRAIRRGVQT